MVLVTRLLAFCRNAILKGNFVFSNGKFHWTVLGVSESNLILDIFFILDNEYNFEHTENSAEKIFYQKYFIQTLSFNTYM